MDEKIATFFADNPKDTHNPEDIAEAVGIEQTEPNRLELAMVLHWLEEEGVINRTHRGWFAAPVAA